MKGYCKDCRWRYKTEYSEGCSNVERSQAEAEHCIIYRNPCPIWEKIDDCKTLQTKSQKAKKPKGL